jgi:flagella basal body P-ring formation protein FlgA
VSPSIVTHAQIVRRLEELRVNMARVLVCGAAECRISLLAEAAAPQAAPAAATGAGSQWQGAQDAAQGPQTLADVLRERVQRELREQGRAEVEFERAGGEFLALTSPPWEFSVRSSDSGKLGLREFSVALRRDGRTQRTVKIGANVKALRRVLVARKPLSVGACIREDDLAAEERLFESGAEDGFGEPAALVGQQVQRFVPAGEMLRRGDVKAVDLVQRSRPVTVIGAGGGVSLQVTGIAIDAGGYGETVRVRLGESRKEQREVRGVVTGIATVRIAEGA